MGQFILMIHLMGLLVLDMEGLLLEDKDPQAQGVVHQQSPIAVGMK